jgi:hypothetical protein
VPVGKQLSLSLVRLAVLGTERIRADAREILRLERPDATDIPSYVQDAAPKEANGTNGIRRTRATEP